MKFQFNILFWIFFIIETIDFAIDLVQGDRFRRERQICLDARFSKDPTANDRQSSLPAKSANHDDNSQQQQSIRESRKETRAKSQFLSGLNGFGADLAWAFKFNRVGFTQCSLFAFNLVLILFTLFRSLLYLTHSTERDQITREFQDPTLKFLESIYICDILYKYDKTKMLYRMIIVVSIQFLINRIRSLHMRIETARINKNRYKRINVTQLDFAYLRELRNSTSGWIKALVLSVGHKCDVGQSLGQNRGKIMRQLARRLENSDKLDRIYYFNQIDFDQCYESLGLRLIPDDVMDRVRASQQDLERQQQLSLDCPDSWPLRAPMTVAPTPTVPTSIGSNPVDSNQSNSARKKDEAEEKEERGGPAGCFPNLVSSLRSNYIAVPVHRVDPNHLFVVFLMHWSAIVSGLTIIVTLMVALFICELEAHGMEGTNLLATIWPAMLSLLVDSPRTVLSILSDSISHSMMGLNLAENGLPTYSSLLCLSRCGKVIKMLNHEVKFHQFHLREFRIFLDANHITLENSTRKLVKIDDNLVDRILGLQSRLQMVAIGSSNVHGSPAQWTAAPNALAAKATTIWGAKGAQESIEQNTTTCESQPASIKSLAARVGSRQRPHKVHPIGREPEQVHVDYDIVVAKYKRQVDEESIIEFNENIRYLLNLIEILQHELQDLKGNFTGFLNINILFAIAGSAVTMNMLIESDSKMKTMFAISGVLATMLPLFAASIMAATSEGAFRRIYHTLNPIQVNDLRMVQPKLIDRIRKVREHLSFIENRSFVLLGNFPLTFGSIASIFGWLFTGILLLQRFIS